MVGSQGRENICGYYLLTIKYPKTYHQLIYWYIYFSRYRFQSTLWATWDQMKQQGFWATWRQLIDLSDPHGEINAYRVSIKYSFNINIIS